MPTVGSGSRAPGAVHGVLLLDKPAGITSNAALRSAQRIFGARKAGHTGTLDPLATGLLALCFGDAARFAHLLLGADKTYRACIQLGVTTTTGDLEGAVTARRPVALTRAAVEAILPRFLGDILQTPPMYSAIKRQGRPLYQLARAGEEVVREPRTVRVMDIVLTGMSADRIELVITCGKGTYIRTLAEDIGNALGCGACLAVLRRTRVGAFSLDRDSHSLTAIEAMTADQRTAALLPADALGGTLPKIELDAIQARRIRQGQAVEIVAARERGLARVYGPDRQFLGLVEITEPGRAVAHRLMPEPGRA